MIKRRSLIEAVSQPAIPSDVAKAFIRGDSLPTSDAPAVAPTPNEPEPAPAPEVSASKPKPAKVRTPPASPEPEDESSQPGVAMAPFAVLISNKLKTRLSMAKIRRKAARLNPSTEKAMTVLALETFLDKYENGGEVPTLPEVNDGVVTLALLIPTSLKARLSMARVRRKSQGLNYSTEKAMSNAAIELWLDEHENA